MKMSISDIPDDLYKGKRVFVRVDFNVPVEISTSHRNMHPSNDWTQRFN